MSSEGQIGGMPKASSYRCYLKLSRGLRRGDRGLRVNLKVLAQPITIWCNAAMLPASLVDRSEEL